MLEAFQAHMQKTFQVTKEDALLVAFSGGLDSTVLAALCLYSGYNIALAHCNFHLRGAESDGDETFVKQWAAEKGVKLHCKSFRTRETKKSNNGSIQMIARKLRYEWFAQIMQEESYGYLLTAHHADDVLETFLINLSRASGLKGLTGIPEKNGQIIRPLLPFSKEELQKFARGKQLQWREDSSNLNTKYLRNGIRHNVVPQLKSSIPSFMLAFQQSINHLQEAQDVLKSTRLRLQASLFVAERNLVRISVNELQKLRPAKAYMHLLFKEFGFTAWEDVTALLHADTGKVIQSKSHRLLKDRNHLLLAELKDDKEIKHHIQDSKAYFLGPIAMRFSLVSELGETHRNVAYVDKDLLSYPLVLRKRQKGDYFYPFGMNGKKKVSKFLKDEKVNGFEKENQWLLCSAGAVVWLVGRRADNRFKVTFGTKNILKITWEE